MPLSARTKRHIATALVDDAQRSKSNEIEALIDTPATMSEKTSNSLEVAMADKKAFAEVKAALESGAASLTKRSGDALAVALADKPAAKEMFQF